MNRVAVVIPCFNYGRFVTEAVESALNQDLGVEVIVVDDGSDDDETIAVLDRLHKQYPIRVHRQKNKGLAAARNAGIHLTGADYIVCLDADDILQPRYCSSCSSILEDHQYIGFVYTTTRVFGAEDYLWSDLTFSSLHLLVDNYIPCSAMFRRKVWEDVGGYAEDLRAGYEDWDFWLSAIEHGWTGYHQEGDLFWYRRHGQSMLAGSNRVRKHLKRLLRHRHPSLYSMDAVLSRSRQETWAIPRALMALAKEEVARPATDTIKRLVGSG